MAYPKKLHQVNGVDVVGDLFRNQVFYLILALLGFVLESVLLL